MRAEIKFSARRFLITLTLCACSVILLQNYNVLPEAAFPQNLLSILTGLAVWFLMFIPAIIIKRRYDADVFSLAQNVSKPEKAVTAAFYIIYFVYVALYFLSPYTDMFCKKYYPGANPCLIAAVLLSCCVYAAFKGVNVITRFGVFLFVLAMITNALMFGGSLSSLDFGNGSLALEWDKNSFIQNTSYFITPCFTAVIFACMSSYTRNFKLYQPVTALLLTGLKYALVIFFISFSVGEYALRQEYQAYVLSRAAHFGSFAGVESFYMALSTMSVFMIVSLLLCCMSRSIGQNGKIPYISAFAAILFLAYLYLQNNSLKEILTGSMFFNIFTFIAAAAVPLYYLLRGRKSRA